MTILIIIDSPTLLILALPYAISRVAIKEKRGRIHGCIACFIFWQLAAILLLIPSVSLLFWHIFPLTLETYIILATIQTIDLVIQIRSLPDGNSVDLSKRPDTAAV
ncbi:MAG: hypothetical protein ACFFD6_02550 [Candidatus Thorarchaeota archaeon]